MKQKNNHVLFSGLAAVVAAFMAAMLSQCGTAPTSLSGGASSTEVSRCVIVGAVVDFRSNPVSGGIVKLRSFNYFPLADTSGSTWTILDTVTNSKGHYRFNNVKAGHYCIEYATTDSLGYEYFCPIDSGETLKVMPVAITLPMAVIRGSNIPTNQAGYKQPAVQTKGMDHSALIDSLGRFTLKVPAGFTRLTLQGIDSVNAPVDTLVYLKAGEHMKLGPRPGGEAGKK
jgi:hypothetical protein